MSRLPARLTRLQAVLPPPPASRVVDLSRLTEPQLERLRELNARIEAVGLRGITDVELEEIAALVRILEEDASA